MRSQTAQTAASLLVMGMLASSCTTANAPAGNPAPPPRAERTKEEGIALASQHKTAAELYQALRDQANGGKPLEWTSLPDWRGVYTRAPVAGFAQRRRKRGSINVLVCSAATSVISPKSAFSVTA